MSDPKDTNQLRKCYQPRKDEEVRGYQVSQAVDLSNLKVPSNLGSAAVTPQNSTQPVPAATKPEK